MPYDFYYSIPTAAPNVTTGGGGTATSSWMLANIIMISVLGGLLLYFLFVAKKNTFSGFLAKVHDFFAFRMFFIEAIMKILYIISVIFVTLIALVLIPEGGIMEGLACFLFGNLALRVGYELMMMFFNLVHDTAEIRKNTGRSAKGSGNEKVSGSAKTSGGAKASGGAKKKDAKK